MRGCIRLGVCSIVALAVAGIPLKWAHAWTCGPRTEIVLPAPGALTVSLDARIWITEGSGPALDGARLVNASDAVEVPTTTQTLVTDQDTTVRSWHPTQPLQPSTEYELVNADGIVLTSFETGTVTEARRPAVPRLLRADARSGYSDDEWGRTSFNVVEFVLEHDGVLLVMDRDERATIEQEPDGAITDLETGTEIALGRLGCLRNFEARGGVETSVRFGAFDIAGNFSGWSDATDVVFEPLPDSSCAFHADGRPLPSAWCVLLVALLRRRTRSDSAAAAREV